MTLDPLKPGSLTQGETARLGASAQAKRTHHGPGSAADAAPAGDSVELSAVSRSLQSDPAAVPQGTLSAERLRQLLDRLAGDYYDRPEVRDHVAQALAHDLDSSPPG